MAEQGSRGEQPILQGSEPPLQGAEHALEGREYFAGSEYTIADIAFLPWIRSAQLFPFRHDLPLDANANLKAWLDRVLARPAVQKGLTIPEPFPPEKQFEGFIKATVGLGELHA
jgi:GST-like protein